MSETRHSSVEGIVVSKEEYLNKRRNTKQGEEKNVVEF